MLAAAVLLVAGGAVTAEDAYKNRIDPSVLETARMGPNASVYFHREIPVLIRSDQPVNVLNVSSATASLLMLGKYHSGSENVDLELHGALKDGALEFDFPLGRLDAALYDWDESGAHPRELEALGAKLQSVTFSDTLGFRSVYDVKRSMEYQLTIEVPVKANGGGLGEPVPSYRAAADFIRALEKDARCRTILAANATGLPIFVSAGDTPGSLAAGFLGDTIRQDGTTGRRQYAYAGPLSQLSRLPEVKRVMRDPAVRSFVDGSQDVLVKALGSDEEGFSFTISRDGGRHLEATLNGKRVTVKS